MNNIHPNGSTSSISSKLPPPLATAADMSAVWTELETDFDTAAQRIVQAHERDGEHRDLPISDLRTWAIAPRNGRFALVPLARHHEPKMLRANGFSSLMTRLGAPSDFIRRLPAPLQLAALNYLLAADDESSAVTLRLRNDEVAAIVSGRFAPLDPVELMGTIRSALARFGILQDVRVRGVASGLVDNLRLVLPSEETAIKTGDASFYGLDITGSSFARSAIHVAPVVWRLVCRNGLRRVERGTGFSFRHVGDRDRLRDAVGEAIPSALVHARGVMAQWRRSVNFMVENVQEQIESLRELSVAEKHGLQGSVIRESGGRELPATLPVYDFINAMTESAKDAAPARRLELESLAGAVLTRHVGNA